MNFRCGPDFWAGSRPGALFLSMFFVLALASPVPAHGKDKLSYGEGLIINVPFPASEVEQVVEDVAQNGVIRGTKEYNKDEFVSGAKAASSSRVFLPWTEGGKVFYKVREQAIDPRNFKDSSDIGTLVVRYVVTPQDDKHTVLRIDALFQEEFRRTIHQSNGSVESSEYKDIHDHLESIDVMKRQNVEALRERQQQLQRKKNGMRSDDSSSSSQQSDLQAFPVPQERPGQPELESPTAEQSASVQPEQAAPAQSDNANRVQVASGGASAQPVQPQPAQSLEEHVKDLRKQVEGTVKAPGAPLKSAPFHTASTLQSLSTGAEILILISTPYWYGVETHDGQHGWVMRDELEQP
jgi:polyhydroxyalkanoate synthesis regulator phasin